MGEGEEAVAVPVDWTSGGKRICAKMSFGCVGRGKEEEDWKEREGARNCGSDGDEDEDECDVDNGNAAKLSVGTEYPSWLVVVVVCVVVVADDDPAAVDSARVILANDGAAESPFDSSLSTSGTTCGSDAGDSDGEGEGEGERET